MNKREEEIAEMISYLSAKSKGFTKPKLIVIGGYALRAFVPFSRYSRDCDFVLKEGLNLIEKWAPEKVSVETVKKKVGSMQLQIFVPSYTDFFLLKVMSARRSDTRDIAALVWKNDVPKDVKKRLDALNDSAIFSRNLEEKIIPDIKNKLFLNSWKGTFITREFTEHDKKRVVKKLKS